jgi:hypothetical protein
MTSAIALAMKGEQPMLLTILLLVVLTGFYALFGALIRFADGVIRISPAADAGKAGSPPRR